MTEEFVEVGPRPAYQNHNKIGGSSLAVLMGLNSFGQKPIDVYRRIVDGIMGGGNVYSDRGTKYEPVVREAFVARTGAVLLPHPGVLFMEDCFAATLDDKAHRGGPTFPVDYKTASNSKGNMRKWGPDGSDKFPENYKVQLTLYMAVLEAPFSELYAAFGVDVKDANGNHTGEFAISEYRRYILQRDLAYEKRCLDVGRKFWREHVVPKNPPMTQTEMKLEQLSPEEQAFFESFVSPMTLVDVPAKVVEEPKSEAAPKIDASHEAIAKAFIAVAPKIDTHPFHEAVVKALTAVPPTVSEQIAESARLLGVSPEAMLPGNEKRFEEERAAAAARAAIPPIVPPDAPKPNPELAVECPNCPDKQHTRAACPVEKAKAAPPAEKRVRGRPAVAKNTVSDKDPEAGAKFAQAAFSKPEPSPVPEAAVVTVGPPPAIVPATAPKIAAVPLVLYVNAIPGPGVLTSSLDPYITTITAALARSHGCFDIRCSDSQQLNFGKWKGALASAVRQNPPAPGAYQILQRDSEIASVVIEALAPLCGPGFPVYGVR